MKTKMLRVPWFIFEYLLVLPLGCIIALAWANIDPERYYRFAHALTYSVNNIGIVFFFGLMTRQVVEATLSGGALHPWRRATLPIAAAVGGVVVPLLIYLGILGYVGEPMLVEAWPATAAIDVAVCYMVANVIFGRHPAVPFLLLLAMASDAIGLAFIAAHSPAPALNIVMGLLVTGVAALLGFAMRRLGVKSFWFYLLIPGVLSWCGLSLAGVHPALALVPVVPLMPHGKHDDGPFEEPPKKAHDALSNFERVWAIPVQAILFLFGLVNAGVPLHGLEAGMWALPVATLIGRPIGILLAVEIATAAGLHRIGHVGWRELLVMGCTASTGLAMAMFFATAILSLGPLLHQTTSGALLTSAGVLVAFVAARLLCVGRFAHPESKHGRDHD